MKHHPVQTGSSTLLKQNLSTRAEEKRGEKSKSTSGTLYVLLDDINDVTPSFEADDNVVTGFAVEETADFGTVVGRVKATDGDGTSPNNMVTTYGIKEWYAPFAITSYGRIRVRYGYSLKADEQSVWNITITAVDGGFPPLTGSVTTIINVTSISSKGAKAKLCAKLITSSLVLVYVIASVGLCHQ
ncbi:hypothetical protein ACF0H5_023346 [Mactra antiquata]